MNGVKLIISRPANCKEAHGEETGVEEYLMVNIFDSKAEKIRRDEEGVEHCWADLTEHLDSFQEEAVAENRN